MELYQDFSDLLSAFSSAGVEFFVVGAHALGVHDRDEAWPNRVEVERGGLMIPFIGPYDFIRNKEATRREQDRLDANRVRQRFVSRSKERADE